MSLVLQLQIFGLRVVLRTTLHVRLHAHHGAAIYALLSAAYGRASGRPPAFPDGVMPDVVEQCRIRIDKGQRYAMGLTLLAADREQAGQRLEHIWRGLQSVGAKSPPGRPALGGNFQIDDVDDLVAGRGLALGEPPEPIAAERRKDPHQTGLPVQHDAHGVVADDGYGGGTVSRSSPDALH